MKKICLMILLLSGSAALKAQQKSVVSQYQSYERGTANARFKDTVPVTINYDLDGGKAEFIYKEGKEPKYPDLKSQSISLAFVDKESNAPAIYAEALGSKDVASIMFYDDKIEIHYRNGNLSVFSGLKAAESAKPKTKK